MNQLQNWSLLGSLLTLGHLQTCRQKLRTKALARRVVPQASDALFRRVWRVMFSGRGWPPFDTFEVMAFWSIHTLNSMRLNKIVPFVPKSLCLSLSWKSLQVSWMPSWECVDELSVPLLIVTNTNDGHNSGFPLWEIQAKSFAVIVMLREGVYSLDLSAMGFVLVFVSSNAMNGRGQTTRWTSSCVLIFPRTLKQKCIRASLGPFSGILTCLWEKANFVFGFIIFPPPL